MSIFDHDFYFSQKFRFLAKNIDFQNFHIRRRLLLLAKISIFDQNIDLRSKFSSSTDGYILGQNFDVRPKFGLCFKISIFDQDFSFWQKFRSSTKISTFDKKIRFAIKIWPIGYYFTTILLGSTSRNIFEFA